METGQRLLYIAMFVMENGRGWMAVKRQPFAGFVNNQNTLCKCSWSNDFVSKVISGFRQKWRKVTASCGGLLWKMEVDEKVHEDALIWDLKVIKVESPDQWQQHHGSLCWGMEQQGEAHVNCAFAKLMTGQKQVQWISYKYLGTLIWSNAWSAPYDWSVPQNAWSKW